MHIIPRLCRTESPSSPGGEGPPPAPPPGGCGLDLERLRPSAQRAPRLPSPGGTASADRRPQSGRARGVGRRTPGAGAVGGGQRSAPSPHFGGQPPPLAPAPPLNHGGGEAGRDPFMPGIGSRCSRGACSCILAFFGKKRAAASGSRAASANPREEGGRGRRVWAQTGDPQRGGSAGSGKD